MFERLCAWIRRVLSRESYYSIDELKAGGHCGCCGAWVGDCVVPKVWPWTVCDKCEKGADHAE